MRSIALLFLAGCSAGPPAQESKALPPATFAGAPSAAAPALQSALEASGWVVEQADERGVATRRREEPEDFAWRLGVALTPRGGSTLLDATLSVERSGSFRPVEGMFRNNARMQADDQYLETKNRPAYERDQAAIEAATPEGRREAGIRRVEGRIRGILAALSAPR